MCLVCDTDFEIENKLFAGLSERLNSFVDKVSNLTKKTRFSNGYFDQVAKYFLSGLEKPAKVEPAYEVVNLAKQSYMEANIYRFSCAKSVSMVTDLNQLIRTQKKVGDFRDFKRKVDELKIQYNKNWLETEYRMTQSLSRNSARHERFTRELDVYQYVKYKTVNDERVRDWHKVLHDKIVKIGSPEYDLISPPLGWRCRCEFVQVNPTRGELKRMESTQDIINVLSDENVSGKQSAYDYMKENGFDKNRAKSGVIFDENRMYIKSFNESGLNYADYDLEDYQQYKQGNPRIANRGSETANYKYDYRDRLIKTNYLNFDSDTLTKPREVWSVFDEDSDTFVKKYILANEVLTIHTTSTEEALIKVENLSADKINKVRKGVLLNG
jgi:SPP1 gp7 family putative phage head morphogenesis protein